MAYFTDTNAVALSNGSRIAALWNAITLKMRQRKVYNQTYNELFSLTQRDLADLGMSRADFRRIAQEAAEITK